MHYNPNGKEKRPPTKISQFRRHKPTWWQKSHINPPDGRNHMFIILTWCSTSCLYCEPCRNNVIAAISISIQLNCASLPECCTSHLLLSLLTGLRGSFIRLQFWTFSTRFSSSNLEMVTLHAISFGWWRCDTWCCSSADACETCHSE